MFFTQATLFVGDGHGLPQPEDEQPRKDINCCPSPKMVMMMSCSSKVYVADGRGKDARTAKYELMHSVRTHLGAEDDAFGCMGNGEDADGVKGVFLRRNVVSVAGRALKANLAALGPLVLPVSEVVRSELACSLLDASTHELVDVRHVAGFLSMLEDLRMWKRRRDLELVRLHIAIGHTSLNTCLGFALVVAYEATHAHMCGS